MMFPSANSTPTRLTTTCRKPNAVPRSGPIAPADTVIDTVRSRPFSTRSTLNHRSSFPPVYPVTQPERNLPMPTGRLPTLSRCASSRAPRLTPAGINPWRNSRPSHIPTQAWPTRPRSRAHRAASLPGQPRGMACTRLPGSRPYPATVADSGRASRGEGPCCPHPSLAFFLDADPLSAP